MAIDTARKRKSAATVGAVWNGPSVVPTGAIDQADRQHVAWSYSGILAGAAGVTAVWGGCGGGPIIGNLKTL